MLVIFLSTKKETLVPPSFISLVLIYADEQASFYHNQENKKGQKKQMLNLYNLNVIFAVLDEINLEIFKGVTANLKL